MKSSKPLSLLTALATAVLVLSGSIAVPILCRPFYYAHIEAMSMPEYTGLTVDQIKQAFDEMLDFCLGLRQDFSVGVLPWSESGRDHFADVRVLFQLDLVLLVLSAAALVLLFLFARKRRFTPARLLGRGPGFWAAAGLAAVFLAVGALAATDFDRAFVIFHSIFFPGKTNWIFDWRTDPIILLLPEDFFRNCAILILVLLVFWCAVLIAADLLAGRRRKRQAVPPACPGCSGGAGQGDACK